MPAFRSPRGSWHLRPIHACALLIAACAHPSAVRPAAEREAPATATATFANPIVATEAGDPWVVRHDDRYYFTATLEPDGGVWVWESPTLTGLGSAPRKVRVWTAPPSGPTSRQIWAPELHRLGGRWYLYFTASDGVDDHHRHYVLAAKTDDPLGPYEPPVRVDPAFEHYAIDGSVLAMPDGRLLPLLRRRARERRLHRADVGADARQRTGRAHRPRHGAVGARLAPHRHGLGARRRVLG